MTNRLTIADWLVHGGHQYEFFKSDHNFLCTKPDGSAPVYAELGRPENKNVTYVTRQVLQSAVFDLVIVRTGVQSKLYESLKMSDGFRGIAVMQTVTPFKVSDKVKTLVWNSKVTMDKYKKNFVGKKHFFIPHGFDPSEFNNLSLNRNNRILNVSSIFKDRNIFLGYDDWSWVSNKSKVCDLIGHGNEKIPGCIGTFPLHELVRKYNEYGVYLNTTNASAMPRSRAEALMCGTPIITTNNYGISEFLKDGRDCIFADNKRDMLKSCNDVLSNNSLSKDLSFYGRESAIKHFHIDDYLSKWEEVFYEAMK